MQQLFLQHSDVFLQLFSKIYKILFFLPPPNKTACNEEMGCLPEKVQQQSGAPFADEKPALCPKRRKAGFICLSLIGGFGLIIVIDQRYKTNLMLIGSPIAKSSSNEQNGVWLSSALTFSSRIPVSEIAFFVDQSLHFVVISNSRVIRV